MAGPIAHGFMRSWGGEIIREVFAKEVEKGEKNEHLRG
jgi:hypothetical protein